MSDDVEQKPETFTSRKNLYPDFTLTSDNCASEPIHRPIAIQGNGHLLVVDTGRTPCLVAISNQLAPCLGQETDALWSMPLGNWLPDSIAKLVSEIESSDFGPRSLPQILYLSGDGYQVTYHQHDAKLTIELEPEADTQVDDLVISAAALAFREVNEFTELFAEAATKIAQSFEYDRVMIYKFDHDQHGCVVGECKIDRLEPFLGLHYPESDIPKMARDLFLLIKSRAISDVNTHYTPLIFNPELGSKPPYLDLSYSQLRATSPIHIQYLKNMDVSASLTFAIIIQGRLWGLIACHHCNPRQVLFRHKLIGEAIADLLAKRIFEIEVEKRVAIEAASRAIEISLLDNVRMSDNYRIQIIEQAETINELCNADGAALVSLEQCVYRCGLAPSGSTLTAICDWLIQEGHTEIFSTMNFALDCPVPVDNAHPIGGMLTTCVCTVSNSFLLWFKHPVSQVVNWAGDPDNSYSVEPADGGGDVQLNPRQSFAKWQVTVEGQSQPWEPSELDMADRVQQGFLKKELQNTAMLVARSNKEFMQLTFAAAHELQEPLRTQSNYLELLKESLVARNYDDLMNCVDRTENSASRMKNLISDLLNYSQLGISNKRETVDLSQIVEIVREELALKLSETQTQLSIGPLPCIVGDSDKIRQLISNLLTNAIKYVEPDKPPEISIFMEKHGSFWTLNIRDNGIGIDAKYQQDIFTMFKRLHSKKEYAGTGIGLAICAKVVEMMDAEIGVTSVPGEGSTFSVRFHNSAIVNNP